MYTRHNALRNARIERYENMYVDQQIEMRKEREEKRKEEELKEKKKQNKIKHQQLSTGERFEIGFNSSETLIGSIVTSQPSLMKLYLSDNNDQDSRYCCDHHYILNKSKVRKLIDKITKLHDNMTDPKPKDSD